MKYPIVEVTWHDAHATQEATCVDELGEFHRPCVTKSVGYEVRSDTVGISLAACEDEDGDWDRLVFIPRGMVVSVRKLGR